MNRDWADFKALNGNIAGARKAFEIACETLFRKLNPDKHVSSVEIKVGDGGIDIFIGELGVEPISVIQCKFFHDTFNESQKSQIRNSFKTAVHSEKYDLKEWILCIPRVIDIDENSWWFKWKHKKITEISKGVSFIKLINGNELIDLFKSSDLYNEVFKIEDSQKISAIYKAVVPNKINKELIWNEQIGNFTFKELYQILSNQKLQIRTQSMIWRDQLPPDEDLLTLFRTYCLLFNIGVDMEESLSDTRYSGYTFGILAPKLIGYGLLEKIEIKSFEIDYIDIKYQTSEVGHRFFALLEKVIHLSSSPNVEDM